MKISIDLNTIQSDIDLLDDKRLDDEIKLKIEKMKNSKQKDKNAKVDTEEVKSIF